MTFVIADRIKESSTTIGKGAMVLDGAPKTFSTFKSVLKKLDTTYYSIAGTEEWETGIGTFTLSPLTLKRDTVIESSNLNRFVDFKHGKKEVLLSIPLSKVVYLDENGDLTISGALTSSNFDGTYIDWTAATENFDTSGTISASNFIDWTAAIENFDTSGTAQIDGDITTNGNVVVDSGKGVDFSDTSALSGMSSELLDDYEEGVYTVAVTCSVNGGYTLSSLNAFSYTKIGRLVHVSGRIQINGGSLLNGTLRVSLPYTVADLGSAAGRAFTPIMIYSHGGTVNQPTIVPSAGNSYGVLYDTNASGVLSTITHTTVNTSFFINVNLTYATTT